MFVYEKRLQYPVRIKNTNPRLAKMIISQYGGPHGEIGASLRYLSQRYSMPLPELKAILTDIGTEGSQWHPVTGRVNREKVTLVIIGDHSLVLQVGDQRCGEVQLVLYTVSAVSSR